MVLVEDKHYQIIPDKGDDQAWNVRIMAGPYTETVLKYGVVKFNGKGKVLFIHNLFFAVNRECPART